MMQPSFEAEVFPLQADGFGDVAQRTLNATQHILLEGAGRNDNKVVKIPVWAVVGSEGIEVEVATHLGTVL